MMKLNEYLEIVEKWYSTSPNYMRLGQVLMNALGSPDSEIFYEKNPAKAVELFVERYISYEDKIAMGVYNES